jgi:hypothetical protein
MTIVRKGDEITLNLLLGVSHLVDTGASHEDLAPLDLATQETEALKHHVVDLRNMLSDYYA